MVGPVWHGERAAHAIEMYLDDEAEADVRRMGQLLADAGLPSLPTPTHRHHRPHITLAVAESLAGSEPAARRPAWVAGGAMRR